VIKGIAEHVPSKVDLRCGPWPALEQDIELGWVYGRYPIPVEALFEIAVDFEHVRDRKVLGA
jgi:hypothetical protein